MKIEKIGIIGGGLAGLTAAIHLSKIGFSVVVFEKNEYPKHKVCGEYISNEVLPYFDWLGISINALKPSKINQLSFSITNGTTIGCELPLGGFGLSRYLLDYHLYQVALKNGCHFVHNQVNQISFENEYFTVETASAEKYSFKIVIGAYGKRSNIDLQFQRDFIQKKSPWLGVKAHFKGNFPDGLVGLHNFNGGYCGISKVENEVVNVCYLSDYESFKKHKNIEEFQKNVMYKNPHLKAFLENSACIFEKPLSISQISFDSKKAVENHILMIGDSAGMIHPLCGNGMAIAIHSAKIVSEAIETYSISNQTRVQLEKSYSESWNNNFKNRIAAGRILAKILQNQKLATVLMRIFVRVPSLLNQIVKRTHGQPIKINDAN